MLRKAIFLTIEVCAMSVFGRLPDVDEINLPGEWSGHLQDVWYDGGDCIYWAQTRSILKTDLSGRILARKDVEDHHAGLEVRNGRLYVAVCPMQGKTKGRTTPECRVTVGEYDAETLDLVKMHVTDINDRSGSLCILDDGTFLVGCLRPPDISPSQVRFHHLDKDFRLIKSYILDNVNVKLGIEVLKRHKGFTYVVPYGMCLKLDGDFKEVARYKYGGAKGLVFDGDDVWIGVGLKNKATNRHASKLVRCKNLPAGFKSGGGTSAGGSFVMDFAGGIGNCRTVNYENLLSVGVETVEGERAFVAKNVDSKKRDVSWGVESEAFAVKEGAEYVVKVRAMGDIKMKNPRPLPCVKWLDAEGKPLEVSNALGVTVPASTAFGFETSPSEWRESIGKGVVPEGAKMAKIYIGADKPDLAHGQRMCISRVEYVERRPGVEWAFGDLEPPEVEQLTPSPNEDLRTSVSFRINDASGIDRAKFRCLLDGADVTERVEWKGDVATYRHTSDWERKSIHEFTLECADSKGNRCEESRFMAFFPRRSSHDRAQLRDDGVILINGKPVFPVSVSGLTPCPYNGRDLDKAVRELRDNHFSIISTGLVKGINGGKWDELADQIVAACEKYGMKTWPHAASQYLAWPERSQKIRMNVVEGRGLSRTFGWNIGDDTSDHRTPEEVKRDSLLIKAIDGDCLTLSSDSASIPGRVAPFAPYVDIFKCELYPIRSETPQAKELPLLQKDIRIAYGDTVRGGAKAPCVVALLQSFKGWTYWKRYPTYEELRAMTFLAIANRARGVAYYTYFSGNGFGAASTPETFAELCRVSGEVAALEPHLVTRDAKRQPEVEVTSGPKSVEFGFPPVTCLLKESGLLVAVNIAPEPVAVRITLPDGRTFDETLPRNGMSVRECRGGVR